MLPIQFSNYNFKIELRNETQYIFDPVRKKYVVLTPEEWVRQHLLNYFIENKQYPKGLMSVEKEIKVNNRKKRYDIVVYNNKMQPWLLVECKQQDVVIDENTLMQLIQYHSVLQCPYWLLSNGNTHYCAKLTPDLNIEWLQQLPTYNS